MLLINGSLYIILDIFALIVSFSLASLARFASFQMLELTFDSWYEAMTLILIYMLVTLFYQTKRPIMSRSNWQEFQSVLAVNMYMALVMALIFYLSKTGSLYSRFFYVLFFVFNCFCMHLSRLYYKQIFVSHYQKPDSRKKMLICANDTNVSKVLERFQKADLYDYEVVAVAVISEKEGWFNQAEIKIHMMTPKENESYLLHDQEGMNDFLKKHAIDEALISIPDSSKSYLEFLINKFETLGMAAHVTVDTFGLSEKEKTIERFCNYNVLTYCPRVFEVNELVIKRIIDIVGGIVGILLTLMLSVFVIPIIYVESPGPVLFKQIRIGKNGRRFFIYKFRSMYMDAEERKKQLLSQNEMNGLMFKMKDDPRITKVGKFIRKTSIDEFPQFFNVLKGDMSLVGTRPPTPDEFLLYEERHKRRLSLKPGITGMWQVSGRSSVQNFEDVVSLDLNYIDNWSIGLDVKILIQTVFVVLFHKGAE